MKKLSILGILLLAGSAMGAWIPNWATTNSWANASNFVLSIAQTISGPTNGVTATVATNIAAYQAGLATNGAVGLVRSNALGSAAYTASTAYDASGAGTTAAQNATNAVVKSATGAYFATNLVSGSGLPTNAVNSTFFAWVESKGSGGTSNVASYVTQNPLTNHVYGSNIDGTISVSEIDAQTLVVSNAPIFLNTGLTNATGQTIAQEAAAAAQIATNAVVRVAGTLVSGAITTNLSVYGDQYRSNVWTFGSGGVSNYNSAGSLFQVAQGTMTVSNATSVFKSPTNNPTDGYVLTATGTGGASAWKSAAGGSQTPLTGDVNGAGYAMTNSSKLATTNLVMTGSLFANLPTPAANDFPSLYCTDVITPSGTGGRVQWDGTNWRTFEGNIKATSDIKTYILNCMSQFTTLSTPISTIITARNSVGGNGLGAAGGSIGFPRGAVVSGGVAGGDYSNGAGIGETHSLTTGTGTTGFSALFGPSEQAISSGDYYGFGGVYSLVTACDGTDTYWAFVGNNNSASGATPPANGCYFLYDKYTNSITYFTTNAVTFTNNWMCVTAKAGVYTVADSGLPVTIAGTPADRLFIIFTSTAAYFYTNGVLAQTLNTSGSLPTTVAMYSAFAEIHKTAGTTGRTMLESRPSLHTRNATAWTAP